MTWTAGMGHMFHAREIGKLIAIANFAGAVEWAQAHPDLVGDGYTFFKEVG